MTSKFYARIIPLWRCFLKLERTVIIHPLKRWTFLENLNMVRLREGNEGQTMANKDLNKAKTAKKDEFYTQMTDIQRELVHYKEHFRGKTVLCNCDDPRVSNFFKYFALKFADLGLKRLIATCYKNQDVDLFSHNECEQAVYQIYDGDTNGNNMPDSEEIAVKPLKGDGDFRSAECIELLKQADIVVTNPPFSLFREYVAQLIKYGKKFIIVGHQNATHYKEIFSLIKDNKLWLGYGFKGNAAFFISKYEDVATAGQHKEGMIRVSGVTWFTNLEIPKRTEELLLCKRYTPEEYPKYENYDAINVNKTVDIPMDYFGLMGVPDTFLEKYNPDQFEIVGLGCGDLAKAIGVRKNYRGRTDVAYKENGSDKCPYSRIIIRRKKGNQQ